jgi:8-oxo-dGTP diphosphatase
MRHIYVACALIEKDGRVLATQRSEAMSLPLKWEFPGGKIHEGERPEDCLKREVREELELEVHVGRALTPVTHHYSSFIVTLYPFLCRISSGLMVLHEHKAFAWLPPQRLSELDWAAADAPILKEYLASSQPAR